MPLRVQEGFPLVTANVAGRPATFLLDTGAQGHLVLPDALARLGLQVDPSHTARMLGTGGPRNALVTRLHELTLGGAPLPGGPTPVAALPAAVPVTAPPLAGLLGEAVLRAYDVELDVRGGRLTLLAPTGCAPPGAAVRLREADGQWLLPVQVNGVPLLAIVDTGSRSTLLSDAVASQLGLDAPVMASTARGVDGQRMTLRRVALRTLTVGADVMRDMPASATQLQVAPADMLLGLDWFEGRRVWLSWAAGVMVVRP